jgi:hypothetical protein
LVLSSAAGLPPKNRGSSAAKRPSLMMASIGSGLNGCANVGFHFLEASMRGDSTCFM